MLCLPLRQFGWVSENRSGGSKTRRRQHAGIQEIGRAVAQMDEMTQQNATLVEQAAAASESLEEQSVQLTSKLAVFRLAGRARFKARQRTGGSGADRGTVTAGTALGQSRCLKIRSSRESAWSLVCRCFSQGDAQLLTPN